jgi:hypothetical protein
VRDWLRALRQTDPAAWSQAVLLVAGNKAGDWSRWYKEAIPVAEGSYDSWLVAEKERREGR